MKLFELSPEHQIAPNEQTGRRANRMIHNAAFMFKRDANLASSPQVLLMITIVFESVYRDDLNCNIHIYAERLHK